LKLVVESLIVGLESLVSHISIRCHRYVPISVFFFQAEDGIRDRNVTGVQTCALPISFSTVECDQESSLGSTLSQHSQSGGLTAPRASGNSHVLTSLECINHIALFSSWL